ncbi:Uncharacterised protein [Nocardia brasiliensis]|nr:Uncharacterised protein [Nocardia brasiliensis]
MGWDGTRLRYSRNPDPSTRLQPPHATPAMRKRRRPDEIECATDAGADRPRRKDSGPEQRTQLHSPEVTHANVSARPCATVVVYRAAFRSRAPSYPVESRSPHFVRPAAPIGLPGRTPFTPPHGSRPAAPLGPTRSRPALHFVRPAVPLGPTWVASRSPRRGSRPAEPSPHAPSRRPASRPYAVASVERGPPPVAPRTFDRRPPCSPVSSTAAPCRPHCPPRPIDRRAPSTVAPSHYAPPHLTSAPRTVTAPPAPSPRPSHRHRAQCTRTAQRRDRAVGI